MEDDPENDIKYSDVYSDDLIIIKLLQNQKSGSSSTYETLLIYRYVENST